MSYRAVLGGVGVSRRVNYEAGWIHSILCGLQEFERAYGTRCLPVANKEVYSRELAFSPDRLHNRPEAARYLLTLATACSDRDTHTLSNFS